MICKEIYLVLQFFCTRLLDIIANLGLQKASVLQHMTQVIQPLLEKGIVEYSIVHTAILEYLTIADKVISTSYLYKVVKVYLQP
jgi:pumilio homology domain family member 6